MAVNYLLGKEKAMTTKTITATTLRTQAAKQKVGKPMRFGIHYSWFNADNLDNAIVERQQSAIRWRNDLADRMDEGGIAKLTPKTVRYRLCWSSRWVTATLYLYSDGSPFCYRRMVNGKQELRFDWTERCAEGEYVVALDKD
jgi:hypothetical protein